MNNTAYAPPGAASLSGAGALSMFSAAVSQAGGVTPLQEAIMSRMRPFGFTGDSLKDLPAPAFLPAAGLGLVRPDSAFPGFPSPFLHPALESRLPSLTASGAFRY